MRKDFLLFSPPSIGQAEINAVVEVLKSKWITTGPGTQKFAGEFKAFINADAALPLNSCTAALHTALVASGVGPGDEVITTPMTFAASVNVIEQVGAKPVFADIQADTLNIDPRQVAKVVTSRTKAILPVHYAGHPVDMDEIMTISDEHDLAVIEDAAHALPAKYKDTMIGSHGNPTAFSFYATKNLTTSEGGMLVGTEELVARSSILSLHGMSRDAWKRYGKEGSWFYEIVFPGFKYNMTDIQAAIGLVQLERLASFQKRRRQIVEAYSNAFKNVKELQIPVERKYVTHAWHLYVLRLNPEKLSINRDEFISQMNKKNIGTSVHFIPMHIHPFYKDKYGYKNDDFPVAYENYMRMLSLPLHPELSDEDVSDVIDAVLGTVDEYRV